MPQSIVPNTQFGLKLPWSCLEIYHREASLQRKKQLLLSPSHLEVVLSVPRYMGGEWIINVQSLVKAMCLSAKIRMCILCDSFIFCFL